MEPYKLLFVDDEGDFLATIKEFFEDLGYIVHTALDGQEALLRVKEHRPNGVFLDISMPLIDGS
jgi:CheY-like chemotaxis protein